ncbi:BTAD domain-containing putative transcriptional regulator [Plantactinospora mayteni]|uniref:SARP family transcriptional regulator n=1 Tax=Plantactinospora mayteni TaxID=566021 RepID=A0ABQ4F446_9ACTN|nr:tetratricopeptide repeat protein [Plantactinospora mayteni]GIH01681.1 SARP family transcriptional regulator [Plantactinospora mayteni]
MEFRLLGQLEVVSHGQVLRLGGAKRSALVAALLLRANHVVTVGQLDEALWAKSPRAAESNLRTYVAGLRALFLDAGEAGSRVSTDQHGYRLEVRTGELDLTSFEELAAEGEQALVRVDTATAMRRMRSALDLWRGPALAGLTGGPYLAVEVDRLDQRRLHIVRQWADAALAERCHEQVAAELDPLLRSYPMWEELWAQLMLAQYRCGRRSAALAAYRAAYQVLTRELGVLPGQALQDLHQRILAADPTLDPPPIRDSVQVTLPVPRQLPADIAAFAGRTEYLAALDALLGALDGERPEALVIAVLTGSPGIGKTTLAAHWAHRVAERFPDGQLYVNLRGFDPGGAVVSPYDAVRGFLNALGMPPNQIPAYPDAQAALYRSLLAGRRMLVVLDNARDAEQVRPLLPGTPGCLAVVTSRDQLAGLVAAEGAHPVTVDLPTLAEGRRMLVDRLGERRAAAEPNAVDEIIAGCARLPLALAIVAARTGSRPDFPLAAIAAELRTASGSLDPFASDDPATDVRAVFSWSYHALSAPAARVFRLLGLHPGPDIAAPAVASLVALPVDRVRPLLGALAKAHLLTERVPGRYAFHDLLRTYAAELAHALDPAADRRASLTRLLGHYLHTAYTAGLLLNSTREPITLPPPPSGVTPEPLTDGPGAVAWLTAEHRVLLAATRWVAEHRMDDHAGPLAWALSDFFQRQGHWLDWVASEQVALTAARRLGDRVGQADAHRGLGFAYARLARHQDALDQLEHALDHYRALDDHIGQANTHHGIGWVLEREGQHHGALSHSQRALDHFRQADDRIGQARALNSVGWCHTLLGNHRPALTHCHAALVIQRELDDRRSAASTLDSLGYIHHQLGDHAAAIDRYQEAIELFREEGDRFQEAEALHHLGDTHLARGDQDAATAAWRRALALLAELGHPDAGTVRQKLDA